jgi:hypothetical protein
MEMTDYLQETSLLPRNELIDIMFDFESKSISDFNGSSIAKGLPLNHHFANGQYAREIFLEKGIVATGAVHKFDHISVISKGKVAVLSTTEGFNIYEAPCTFSSPACTKRLIMTFEDTHWTTLHNTNTTNIDDLFNELTCNDKDFCKEVI